ncbi:hypothetical protein [Mucilaginibacter sp.]|uniref:hypothetical protein n=1 Tax=Mucilaginibacter sp. TaxID=1882438 RepID=UPI0025D1DF79|nr:hypothetical protein [Mucilaginibacter sp.]
MPAKLFVNNTGYEINGNLTVRAGSQPGQNLNSVQFVLDSSMGSQQVVNYGDPNNLFMDQLEISTLALGGYIISNQIVVTRGSIIDDMFNTNDTITIALNNQSFVVTTSNTWTI